MNLLGGVVSRASPTEARPLSEAHVSLALIYAFVIALGKNCKDGLDMIILKVYGKCCLKDGVPGLLPLLS